MERIIFLTSEHVYSIVTTFPIVSLTSISFAWDGIRGKSTPLRAESKPPFSQINDDVWAVGRSGAAGASISVRRWHEVGFTA